MGVIQRTSGARLPALVGLALWAGACGLGDEKDFEAGLVEGFAGLVAADEPRAALIGRDVLGGGGNAADAAVAMYFTMGVTLPSRAGLGGGGICLVFDHGDKGAAVVEFLARRGPSGGVVPRGVRAMAALHARHGLARWEALVSPAEHLARFGHPISRAFARDLARAAGTIRADPAMARLFGTASGNPPREGESITQFELSGILAGIRLQGGGYFHAGPVARRFAQAASAAGQYLTAAELRDASPRIQKPARVKFGTEILYFPRPPAESFVAGEIWRILDDVRDYGSADAEERPHLFVETAMRAFADPVGRPGAGGQNGQAALLDEDRLARLMADYDESRHIPAGSLPAPPARRTGSPEGAGFVVGDRWGNAVACTMTMNALFGAGRVAAGTGILLAAPPAGAPDGNVSASVVILGNEVNGDAHMAAAASGGAVAPTALAAVLLAVLTEDRPLSEAISAPRLHHGGAPDLVLYEPAVAPPVLESLRVRGHELEQAAELGRVGAFYCVRGVMDSDKGCAVMSDPRGRGLATFVE